MDIAGWNQRYLARNRCEEDFDAPPTALLVETARKLRPGRALDLACGTGRNALWLASHGWITNAIDGAPAAIEALRRRAEELGVSVTAQVADLQNSEYSIGSECWDLIAICYYLQRNLFEPTKRGIAPGGVLVAIVHITDKGEEPTETRLRPGELQNFFEGWRILHSYEGTPNDPAHRRAVAEIVAQRLK